MENKIENIKTFSPGLHKLIHHQEHLAKIEKREPVGPIHVSVWPTNRCQLRCSYCAFRNHKRDSTELSLDNFKKAVDVLKKYGLKALEFSGGGEPLLWTYFNEAVIYAKEKKLNLCLVTNGLELENIPQDILKRFSWIRASVQSVTYAEKIRMDVIPNSVRKSMSFIVPDIKRFEEIKGFSEFSKKTNTIVRISPIRPCSQEWANEVKNEVEKYKYPLLFFDKTTGAPLGCYFAWIRGAIDWRGNYLPCPSIEVSFESAGGIPDDFPLCHVSELEKWILNNPTYDLGYRCTHCNCGKEVNDYVHNLLKEVEDVDFV